MMAAHKYGRMTSVYIIVSRLVIIYAASEQNKFHLFWGYVFGVMSPDYKSQFLGKGSGTAEILRIGRP